MITHFKVMVFIIAGDVQGDSFTNIPLFVIMAIIVTFAATAVVFASVLLCKYIKLRKQLKKLMMPNIQACVLTSWRVTSHHDGTICIS